MEEVTYSNIKNKKVKRNLPVETGDQLGLEHLIEINDITEDEIVKAYFQELKNCLGHEDLHALVSSILEVEHLLEKLSESFEGIVPDLTKFYNSLSPLVLRALRDSLDLGENAESCLNSIKEAIRICLEDELYH